MTATRSRQWLDEHDMACWWCGAEAPAGVCARTRRHGAPTALLGWRAGRGMTRRDGQEVRW